jgi:hypothetical protein
MAKIRWNQHPKMPAPTGVCTFINALAFSTLLSSQETDAHLRRNSRSLPGQPLNFTPELPSCQLRFRKLSGRLRRQHYSHSRHQGSSSVSLVATVFSKHRGHARPLEVGSSVAPRGPGSPSGVPSLSGQDELYGWREPPSNRELYPAGVPVLTCPNRFGTGVTGVPRGGCQRGRLAGAVLVRAVGRHRGVAG